MTLKRPEWEGIDFPSEVIVLRASLRAAGYDATPHDIAWAWQQHSDAFCASWLSVGTETESQQVATLKHYLEEVE
jgi:hypothetical protein